jgi:hypothetical protein
VEQFHWILLKIKSKWQRPYLYRGEVDR